MSLYILDEKTYNTNTQSPTQAEEEILDLSSHQLRQIATNLSEHFGCFMLFGMSLKGEPRMLMSSSSGMEHLAMKKFAEDVVIDESGVNFVPLGEEENSEDNGEEL